MEYFSSFAFIYKWLSFSSKNLWTLLDLKLFTCFQFCLPDDLSRQTYSLCPFWPFHIFFWARAVFNMSIVENLETVTNLMRHQKFDSNFLFFTTKLSREESFFLTSFKFKPLTILVIKFVECFTVSCLQKSNIWRMKRKKSKEEKDGSWQKEERNGTKNGKSFTVEGTPFL